MDRRICRTTKQCLELLQSLPDNNSDAAEMDNEESGFEVDRVRKDEFSSEEDASEVPGLSVRRGCRRSRGRRSNLVATPARMPATSPGSAPEPDPAATSEVAPAPPGTQEAGNDGTVWNTINPGVEAAGAGWESSAKNEVKVEEVRGSRNGKKKSSGMKSGLSRKDELFKDLINQFTTSCLDFPKSIAQTDGSYFVQDAHELFHVLTSSLEEEERDRHPRITHLFDVQSLESAAGMDEKNLSCRSRGPLHPLPNSWQSQHPFHGRLTSNMVCKRCDQQVRSVH
ncbi:UNVERIFIED_CONTAM: hypothetical protein FKN15_003406 [Acipenser sinensis]